MANYINSKTSPNILFLFTDQQRADTLSCYGNTEINTPNLDKFANSSFVFENAYVSQPLCTPARSTILSGTYPHTNGCTTNNIPLDTSIPTIAELVDSKYHRAYFGKWNLGDEVIPQHGFTHRISIDDGYRAWYSNKKYLDQISGHTNFLKNLGYTPDEERFGAKVYSRQMSCNLPIEHTKASFMAKEINNFLDTNKHNPFILYAGFFEPHPPYSGPLNKVYNPEILKTPPHFLKKPDANTSYINQITAEYYSSLEEYDGSPISKKEDWKQLRANYYGNVSLIDQAIGNILDHLKEIGIADNTIVVYTSEHGEHLGDHSTLEKGLLYEESIKVPLIIHVPWLEKQPSTIKGYVSHIDIVPTLLDLIGTSPLPSNLQGKSIVNQLIGNKTLEDNYVFIENDNSLQWKIPFFNEFAQKLLLSEKMNDLSKTQLETMKSLPWRSIISPEGLKLNLHAIDHCELYDLKNDPFEQINLYNHPNYQKIIKMLATKIYNWQIETNDDSKIIPKNLLSEITW